MRHIWFYLSLGLTYPVCGLSYVTYLSPGPYACATCEQTAVMEKIGPTDPKYTRRGPSCHVTLLVGMPVGETAPKRVTYIYEYDGIAETTGGKLSCDGFQVWSGPGALESVNQWMGQPRGFTYKTTSSQAQYNYMTCMAYIDLDNGNSKKAYYVANTACPIPAPMTQCQVEPIREIVHREGKIGLVNSRADGEVRVVCNQTASVMVSVEGTALDLKNELTRIESRIYVGSEGNQMVIATASPGVNVPIVSVVNAVGTAPGVYRGTKIVIVAWD